MEQFGETLYCVLCKTSKDMTVDSLEEVVTHKGTGFVRFKN